VPVAYRTNAAGQVDSQGDLSAALTSQTDPCTQFLTYAIQERAICENPLAGPDGIGVRTDDQAYTVEARQVPQAVAFVQNTRDEVRLMGGDGQSIGALAAEPGMKQQCYVAFNPRGREGGSLPELAPDNQLSLRAASGGSSRSYVALHHPLEYNGLNGRTLETDSVTILRVLRKEIGETPFTEWGTGVLDFIRQEKILQPQLLRKSNRSQAEADKSGLDGITSQSKENLPEWALYALRVSRERGRSPQRRKLAEQYSRELGETLSKLPHERASRSAFLHCLWQASEGLGILRQALSAIQEMGRSSNPQGQPVCFCEEGDGTEPSEGMLGSGVQSEISRTRLLQQTRDAKEARKTSVIGGQGSAMQFRRLTPL
jgi:hypothetical protein